MRAWISMLAAALLIAAAGCSKTDDASRPMDQPADSPSTAPMPDQTSEDQTIPPSDTTTPPPPQEPPPQ